MLTINSIVSLVLVMVCVLSSNPIRIYAAEEAKDCIDYYENRYVEEIVMAGETYQLEYSYDDLDNRCITIYHLDKIVDIIVYNKQADELYVNGNQVLEETAYKFENSKLFATYDANWIVIGSGTRQITNLETMTELAFVAGIAAYIGSGCTAALVLSAMGASTVGYIITHFNKANVSMTVSKFNSNLITQFRYDWSVTPVSGPTYGPYMSLSKIM